MPEGTSTIPSREEQLASLHNTLMGNQAFAACRGMTSRAFADITQKSDSPAAFCADWDIWIAKARVMGSLLVRFKRDGWKFAYDELQRALCDSRFIMTGETVPVESTSPYTVVMFDPRRTLLMIKWILDNLTSATQVSAFIGHRRDEEVLDHTRMMFKEFPTLEKHARLLRQGVAYPGPDLCKAYHDIIDSRFEADHSWAPLTLGWHQWNDSIELYNGPHCHFRCAYLCRGHQADVLNLFSRELQDEIATWQLYLPNVATLFHGEGPLSESRSLIDIGFHKESEHDRWRKIRPGFVSSGFQWGLGVLAAPNDVAVEGYGLPHQGSLTGDRKFRFMLTKPL